MVESISNEEGLPEGTRFIIDPRDHNIVHFLFPPSEQVRSQVSQATEWLASGESQISVETRVRRPRKDGSRLVTIIRRS